MDKEILYEFNRDISKVMEYITSGRELEARHIFNTRYHKKYDRYFRETDTPLEFATEMWRALDIYLNSEPARILGDVSTDKKYILSVYADYQKDFKKETAGS